MSARQRGPEPRRDGERILAAHRSARDLVRYVDGPAPATTAATRSTRRQLRATGWRPRRSFDGRPRGRRSRGTATIATGGRAVQERRLPRLLRAHVRRSAPQARPRRRRRRDRCADAPRCITGITGPGRIVPGRAPARAGLPRSSAWCGARAPRTSSASRTSATASSSARPTCSTSSRSSTCVKDVRPDEIYNLAAQSFVPTSWLQPVLTAEFDAVGVTRAARGDAARSTPKRPLLPGELERDVRQGARDAAARDDAVPSAQPVRRRQGLRPLHHGQLPRELRALRRARASSSTTSRRAAAASSSRARSPTASRRIKLGLATELAHRATSTRAATGASPATTSRRCGACSSRPSPTTTSSRPARRTRCASWSTSRSACVGLDWQDVRR